MAVVLLASDTAAVRHELVTTLEGPDLQVRTVTNGAAVRAAGGGNEDCGVT